jgi:hypothetical protein
MPLVIVKVGARFSTINRTPVTAKEIAERRRGS